MAAIWFSGRIQDFYHWETCSRFATTPIFCKTSPHSHLCTCSALSVKIDSFQSVWVWKHHGPCRWNGKNEGGEVLVNGHFIALLVIHPTASAIYLSIPTSPYSDGQGRNQWILHLYKGMPHLLNSKAAIILSYMSFLIGFQISGLVATGNLPFLWYLYMFIFIGNWCKSIAHSSNKSICRRHRRALVWDDE